MVSIISRRILINAVSIKEGGSLVVLNELLKSLLAIDSSSNYYVAISQRASLDDEVLTQHAGRLVMIRSDLDRDRFLGTLLWYCFQLPRLVRKYRIGILFSLTNYLPIVPVNAKELLLVQHCGHFSTIYRSLVRKNVGLLGQFLWKIKSLWVFYSILKSTKVTVQTKYLKNAILEMLPVSESKIHVVRHGPGLMEASKRIRTCREEVCEIGYITKPGLQKNFDVLLRALIRLKSENINARLHITMNPNDSQTIRLTELATSLGVRDMVINHGNQLEEGVERIYLSLDIFVFPSLCESFGFPLIEAMTAGIPVVVSNSESNLELHPYRAPVFSCYDDKALASIIKGIATDREYAELLSKESIRQAKMFNWHKTAIEMVELMNEL